MTSENKRIGRYKYADFLMKLDNESLYDPIGIVNLAEHMGLFEQLGLDRSQGAVLRAIDTLYRTTKRKLPAEADDYLEEPPGIVRHAYYGWRWKMLLPINRFSAAEWNEMLALQTAFLELRDPEFLTRMGIASQLPEVVSSNQPMSLPAESGGEVRIHYDRPPVLEPEPIREPKPKETPQQADEKQEEAQTAADEQTAAQDAAESKATEERPGSQANIPEVSAESAAEGKEESPETNKQAEIANSGKEQEGFVKWRQIPRFVRFSLVTLALSGWIILGSQVIGILLIKNINQYYSDYMKNEDKNTEMSLAWRSYREAEFELQNRNFALAEKLCNRSIKEFGNDNSRALPQFLMINLLIMTGRLEEADVCIEEARQFCEAIEWPGGLRAVAVKKIQRLVAGNQLQQARNEISLFFRAYDDLAFAKDAAVLVDKAYIHYLLGSMSYTEGNYQDYAKNAIQSLTYTRLSGLDKRSAVSSSYVGFSQLLIGQTVQARKYLREAESALSDTGNPEFYHIQNQVFIAFLPETLAEERQRVLRRAESFLLLHPDEDLSKFCEHLRSLDLN